MNSYGSLGYATRLRITLERVPGFVALRHVRFDDAGLLAKTTAEIVETHEHDGQRVDGLDGVAFEPGEYYLTLAQLVRARADDPPSDYAGQQIYYRSIQQRGTDLLTMLDYLWRWDTDWFWCSRAMGAQHPLLRRVWPRRLRRSDVFHRLIALNDRTGFIDKVDRVKRRPQRERVVQDVEVPVERLEEFLDWFDREVGMRPVWLCPLVSPGTASGGAWPSYPLRPRTTYVNIGFWGTVHVGPDALDAPLNRAIEAKVHDLDGHKSLYSEAFYDRDTFDRLYGGANLAALKAQLRPRRPVPHPLRQGGAQEMTRRDPDPDPDPLDRRGARLAAQGAAAGPVHRVRRQRDRSGRLGVPPPPGHRARPHLPAHRAGRPRLQPGVRRGRPRAARRAPR